MRSSSVPAGFFGRSLGIEVAAAERGKTGGEANPAATPARWAGSSGIGISREHSFCVIEGCRKALSGRSTCGLGDAPPPPSRDRRGAVNTGCRRGTCDLGPSNLNIHTRTRHGPATYRVDGLHTFRAASAHSREIQTLRSLLRLGLIGARLRILFNTHSGDCRHRRGCLGLFALCQERSGICHRGSCRRGCRRCLSVW